MRRVLVVGGTGFTGERVTLRLLRRGFVPTVLTREPDTAIAKRLRAAGARVFPGDCLRRWTLWEALESCDMVVSCSHTRFAEACVQACKTIGVGRIVVMSSTRRFTRFPDRISQQVIEGEAAVAASGLDWTVVRSTMIFGGSRDRNMCRLLDWFRRRSWFPVIGRGTGLVQPVFVEDVVDAVVAALERDESVGQALTVAGPEAMTLRKLLTEVAKSVGVRNPWLPGLPLGWGLTAAAVMRPLLGSYGITPDMVQRLAEDKHVNTQAAREVLGVKSMPFAQAIKMEVEGSSEVDVLYPGRTAADEVGGG